MYRVVLHMPNSPTITIASGFDARDYADLLMWVRNVNRVSPMDGAVYSVQAY